MGFLGRTHLTRFYRFLLRDGNSVFLCATEGEKVVGFVGWMLTTREKAEAWLVENHDIPFQDSVDGDCVVRHGAKPHRHGPRRWV